MTKPVPNKYFLGTSGLALPVTQDLYPDEFKGKSRMNYYSFLFNSVEINSSFYKTPSPSTVKKWSADVLNGFRFTFKFSKAVTHSKQLLYDKADLVNFMGSVNNIGAMKGCLLVQLPPSARSHLTNQLRDMLLEVQTEDPDRSWNIAVEFRDRSWYDEKVYAMLEDLNIAIVSHDLPASRTPDIDPTADFYYYRFHGPEGRYSGSYSDEFLEDFSEYIRSLDQEGKEIYIYFNNTMGSALQNLIYLRNLFR